MKPFERRAVLISTVIGLGITHLLTTTQLSRYRAVITLIVAALLLSFIVSSPLQLR